MVVVAVEEGDGFLIVIPYFRLPPSVFDSLSSVSMVSILFPRRVESY